MQKKFLIIRFSSFGDIVQCLSTVESIYEAYPEAVVDWVVRSDFANVLHLNQRVNRVWSFDRAQGLKGLIHFAKNLKAQNYDYVYDAHSNLRSRIIKIIIAPWWKKNPRLITRPKERLKRFFLFRLRINFFAKPYRGMVSYQNPLKKWNIFSVSDRYKGVTIPKDPVAKVQRLFEECFSKKRKVVVLVPSAAWKMKRWPLEYWQRLIKILPGYNFAILGGPQDKFCQDLVQENVYNFAGELSLLESCAMVKEGYITISADTGLLHVADYFGTPAIALLGPTAFGFPTGKHVETLEVSLKCRPCSKDGRGKCRLPEYQKCMTDITPERVANCVRNYEITCG